MKLENEKELVERAASGDKEALETPREILIKVTARPSAFRQELSGVRSCKRRTHDAILPPGRIRNLMISKSVETVLTGQEAPL